MRKSIHSGLKAGFGLIIGLLTLGSCANSPEEERLPILGSREPVVHTVNGREVTDTIYHQIPEFSFLNQDSVIVDHTFFEDGVYIANFFFTSCPSICPTMQKNLSEVYAQYKNDPRVKFLSHSIDFRHDSPSVLRKYADKHGVTNNHWQFVTGSKSEIYGISEAYMVYTKEDAEVPGGYDHSGYFILVDKDRHIRGAYDGTSTDQINLMLRELEILLKEYQLDSDSL